MKSIIKNLYYKFLKFYRSKSIKNKTVTIISNNCWGGFMYQSCSLKYQSPFIGLFMFAPDYIKMLENLEENLTKRIKYINQEDSKYKNYLKKNFIIGVFEGTDIEIIFKHYHSIEEVEKKWNRRLKRINLQNMIVKFSDSDLCTDDLIYRFEALPFQHKVCFTAKPYPDCKCVKYMPEHKLKHRVTDEWATSYRYYNFVKEANKITEWKQNIK